MSRQTHTFVILDLSPEAFAEIKAKLADAGYDQVVIKQGERTVLDMHGIAVGNIDEAE